VQFEDSDFCHLQCGLLHIGTVILASHSMSGNETTEFARRHPQRVKKLIYIEAAYDFTKMPASDRDPLQMETPKEADLKSVAAGMRSRECLVFPLLQSKPTAAT
jgi:pimeloyl-ACP methyl ester carboxylesterase